MDHVHYRIVLLLSSLVALTLMSSPRLVDSKQLKTVQVGEAVEFSCSLTETLPAGDISWQIQWDDSVSLAPVTISGEITGDVTGPEFNSDHGEFRIMYESSRGIRFTHHSTIIIVNIQLADAGEYNCKHNGNFRDRGIFSEHELRVLPRPPDDESPECSYVVLSTGSSTTSPNIGDTLELSCHFTGGAPPARLHWYKQGLPIGEILENSNVMEYQLQPADNGEEFSCHAMSPALSERSYCHLTPLEIQPSVTLTPSQARVPIDGDVTFTCIGEGVPGISDINWFIDGAVQRRDKEGQIILTNLSMSRSELRLSNLQVEDDGTDILCEVSVASGMTADSLGTITITDEVTTTVTTPVNRVTTKRQSTVTTLQPSASPSPKTTQFSKTSIIISTDSSKTTTQAKRVVINGPEPKLDKSNQQPPTSSSNSKSNIPVTAAVVGIICLIILIIIIVVVIKRRNDRNNHKVLQPVPSSPTDSFPDPTRNPMIEYENRMYEGTIISCSSPTKTSENFYQTLPLDGGGDHGDHEQMENPEQTWIPAAGPRDSMDHEGCGAWEENKNHHYENTAIGRPFPTFARQQEPQHFLYDHVERKSDSTI